MEINVATETFLFRTSKLAAALVSRVSLEAARIDPEAKMRRTLYSGLLTDGWLQVAAGAVGRRVSILVAFRFLCNQELIALVTLSLARVFRAFFPLQNVLASACVVPKPSFQPLLPTNMSFTERRWRSPRGAGAPAGTRRMPFPPFWDFSV